MQCGPDSVSYSHLFTFACHLLLQMVSLSICVMIKIAGFYCFSPADSCASCFGWSLFSVAGQKPPQLLSLLLWLFVSPIHNTILSFLFLLGDRDSQLRQFLSDALDVALCVLLFSVVLRYVSDA